MKKYLFGSENDFHNFIGKISKDDKLGIVTHTDLDGIASAVFLQKILESKNLKISSIYFINYDINSLNKILEKDYDKLIFTDVNLDNFLNVLEELRKKSDVLIFDHHPLNENLKDKKGIIKTESKYCSSHALFDLSKKYFDTNNLEWLVCSAIITDYTWDENFDFIKSIYPKIKKEVIFESKPGKIGRLINEALIYYSPDYRKVYDLVLKKDLSSLEKASKIVGEEVNYWVKEFREKAEFFPEKKLFFLYRNPKYNIISSVTTILSDKYFRESTLVFVSDVSDKTGFVKISSRNQSGEVNLNDLLKKSIEGFEHANAGGHVKASGASFPKKSLSVFKERMLNELK